MKIPYLKLIPYIIIAILIVLLSIKSCENSKITKQNEEKQIFLTALNDSLHIVKNKNGELEYSKKSLQNDISFLKENINLLSDNQKALVKEIQNNKNVIAAMRADVSVLVEHIKSNGNYKQTNDTTLIFTSDSSTDKNLQYEITISGVKPSYKPELTINKIELPNTTTVKFEWSNDGKKYPVKGTIINSNPYFKVDTLDSFIIPEIKKETLKPSTWQKIKLFTNKTGSKIVLLSSGVIIGFTLHLLLK